MVWCVTEGGGTSTDASPADFRFASGSTPACPLLTCGVCAASSAKALMGATLIGERRRAISAPILRARQRRLEGSVTLWTPAECLLGGLRRKEGRRGKPVKPVGR